MITHYSFGKIIINDKEYRSDVIIYEDKVKEEWWRIEGHSLCIDDIKEVLDRKPEVIIVGTGQSGFMNVPKDVRKHVEKLNIELVAKNTTEAVKIYNELKDKKKVIACLHLTC